MPKECYLARDYRGRTPLEKLRSEGDRHDDGGEGGVWPMMTVGGREG